MPTHALAATYRHGCRCAECCRAATLRMRDERDARQVALAEGRADPAHGTTSTYDNYRCRCDACKRANTMRSSKRRAVV